MAWFARIDSHDSRESPARIGNSSDSCESSWRTIKIGVSIANDSRESIRESPCESPVPLRFPNYALVSREGDPPKKPPTQIKTVCTNSLRKLFCLFSAYFLRERGTVCTHCPEIVCANCLCKLFLFGWVVFWVGLPFMIVLHKTQLLSCWFRILQLYLCWCRAQHGRACRQKSGRKKAH